MTRDDVLDVVKQEIFFSFEDLDQETFDPSLSLVDYGALSIDIVGIVANSMKNLQVKLPREQLYGLQTIDALVDALWKAVQERPASETPADSETTADSPDTPQQ